MSGHAHDVQGETGSPDTGAVVLEAERLSLHYLPRRRWGGGGQGAGGQSAEGQGAGRRPLGANEEVVSWAGRPAGREGGVRAVEDVSLRIREGETLALVGESGCGKSTTARLLLGLEPATGGTVRYRGRDLRQMSSAEMLEFRRRVQLVFQDPFASLNPRLTVGGMLREVLSYHRLATAERRGSRVTELLELVGLSADAADRYPHEFSGGQRQRIGIARALAVEPELIVADEPVSALDVSIQAQVLNLLMDLQDRLRLSYLFISHDLAVVRQVADRVAVMYAGRIVEAAEAVPLYASPLHPYTLALLAAVPRPRPAMRSTDGLDASGAEGMDHPPASLAAVGREAPSSGCPYFARCAHPARNEECRRDVPALEEREAGRWARCIKVEKGRFAPT